MWIDCLGNGAKMMAPVQGFKVAMNSVERVRTIQLLPFGRRSIPVAVRISRKVPSIGELTDQEGMVSWVAI